MNIDDFIRTQRLRLKLTQIQLAELLGVSNTTISNYEKGITTPDLKTFAKISKIFCTECTPLISILENNANSREIYENVYSKFCGITKDIPSSKIATIPARREWKCKTVTPQNLVVVENNPRTFNDYDLVIAPVPNGEEHIYKIRFCGNSTYLVPEEGPPYLCTVRIDTTTHLKRILAIIRYS